MWFRYYGSSFANGTSGSSADGIGVNIVVINTANTSGSFVVEDDEVLENEATVDFLTSSETAEYEPGNGTTAYHTFRTRPLMVRVSFDNPIYVLGQLDETPSSSGFNTVTASTALGLRATLKGRNIVGNGQVSPSENENEGNEIRITIHYDFLNTSAVNTSAVFRGVLASWRFDDTASPLSSSGTRNGSAVIISGSVANHYRRTCVPLTIRDQLNSSDFDSAVETGLVYRRSPVDCVVANSIANSPELNEGIFGPGGLCSGTQNLEYPTAPGGDATNNAGLVTNLKWFSRWAQWSSIPWVAMSDTSLPTSSLYNSIDLQYRLDNARRMSAPPASDVPNCQGSINCVIAYDRTAFVPCSGTFSTVWFTCMKPTMMALFPEYTTTSSSFPTTPMYFPTSLYVSQPSVDAITDPEQLEAQPMWWTQ